MEVDNGFHWIAAHEISHTHGIECSSVYIARGLHAIIPKKKY